MKGAIVQVTVKVTIEFGPKWGEECTIGQMKKQAREEAVHYATRKIQEDVMVKSISAGDVVFSTTL